MFPRFALVRTLAAATLALSVVSAACSDSDRSTPISPSQVRSVLVEVVGGGTVTFKQQQIASGTLTLANNSVVREVIPRRRGEEALAAETGELRAPRELSERESAGLVFTPSPNQPFAGTFTRTTPTTTPMVVQFELYHTTGEAHQDGRLECGRRWCSSDEPQARTALAAHAVRRSPSPPRPRPYFALTTLPTPPEFVTMNRWSYSGSVIAAASAMPSPRRIAERCCCGRPPARPCRDAFASRSVAYAAVVALAGVHLRS